MFYGLNNFVKNILPKRLFYRSLLIVAVPVIALQLIISIVCGSKQIKEWQKLLQMKLTLI